jgi:hypothetical protein
MNEELHADFVSHFTEFLVKYGHLLECCEKCHMDIAGQYLINPTEETKTQKDNINILAEHLKNFIPLFLEVQKAEEKMETK